jgi:hypothetical protein
MKIIFTDIHNPNGVLPKPKPAKNYNNIINLIQHNLTRQVSYDMI